jgi:large subunit ribosomal protein L5
MNRLHEKYQKEIRDQLKKELGYANVHQIPRIEKVVVNAGVGRAVADSKHLENVTSTLTKVTGQAPVTTVAKNSIAGFKLREGNKIGVMVTLRGERMYEFLDRLISITLPRIRDFRGISDAAFDRQGNYSVGLREQAVFPEISFEESGNPHGLQVNVITTAKTKEESKRLLELMGFPFRRNS